MKNIIGRITLCGLFMALLGIAGCKPQGLPEIKAGVDACDGCNMVIDKVNQACGYFADDGFIVFDAPGCMILRLDEYRAAGERMPARLYFADYQTARLLPRDSTVFLLTAHLPTVMGSGVLCFADRNAAQALRAHEDEITTNWSGCFARKAEANRQLDLVITADAARPEIVELQKGDVAAFHVTGEGLSGDVAVRIKGYEEIAPVIVSAAGDAAMFRLYADKPGAGFPLERIADGKTLGMIKVEGAHTEDEEEM